MTLRDNKGRFVKGHHSTKSIKNKLSKAMIKNKEIYLKIHTGSNNNQWKGEKASYYAKHIWLFTHYGKARECEECKCKNKKRYEWANISGKYLRDRSDYKQLCTSCHKKYDIRKAQLEKLKK